jgi:hypothetical protein
MVTRMHLALKLRLKSKLYMEKPSLVFSGQWFDMYFRLLLEKYKIMSLKKHNLKISIILLFFYFIL